jgi:hypothetical protein
LAAGRWPLAAGRWPLAAASLALCTLAACGGGDGATGPAGANGLAAVLRSTPEPAGANCATGGTRLQAGADTNFNATLDDSEVTTTAYVCNGPAGATGATGSVGAPGVGTTGPAGAPGATGAAGTPGATGSTGPAGATGAAGSTGSSGLSSLIKLSAEPAGANCRIGGTKVEAGLDASGNGALEAAEVSSTTYLCSV